MATSHLLLVLLLCSGRLGQSSKLVRVSPALFSPEESQAEGECPAAQPRKSSTSIPLMHVQANCSPYRNKNSTWLSAMLDSIKGDDQRYQAITQGWAQFTTQEDADVALTVKSGHYIINLGFGTPPQRFYMLVDTGSDISWVPCAACPDCTGDVFDPSKSPTFKYLSCSSDTCQELGSSPNCGNHNCSLTQTYGDGSQVTEVLSTDTLAVASQTMPDFSFGCSESRTGLITSAPGLVGFGRRSISFTSQTANLFEKTFSYCIPSSTSTGCLELGKSALSSSSGMQFTSLLTSSAHPSFYYVALIAVSVGDDRVSVPAMDDSSGGGTIIDSGTFITRLAEPAYGSVRDSFVRQFSNVTPAPRYSIFDACFNIPSQGIAVPQITLHFDNNVDVPLPADNYLFPANEEGSVACLAFAPSPTSSDSGLSIFGSYQQRNFRVVYDVAASRLGIVSETCKAC